MGVLIVIPCFIPNFNENLDLHFQACGYEYVGNEAYVITSIYNDGDTMYAQFVLKNSSGEVVIDKDYFQIDSTNDILVKRKIF